MTTSIDFLLNELLQNKLLALRYDKDSVIDEIVAKTNEIHKQEIIDAWEEGNTDYMIKFENGEEYYKEKFKK